MNDNLPLVSVLMTSYNREKYIDVAIRSVLSSTYRNFELIVVDDRSSDKTVEIANSYAAIDSRIKIYINEKNLGDYPNRNRAASYAKGKYLKYIDSDDYVYPWGIQLLVDMMEKFPESGWGLCSLSQDVMRPFPFELTPYQAYEYNYMGPGLFHKAPLSSIIKKLVFDEVGGFVSARMVGDNEMWHRLAVKYRVVLMPEGIVWNRAHGSREMNSYSKYALEYEKIMIRYLRSNDCPLGEMALDILNRKRLRNRMGLIKAAIKLNPILLRMHWSNLQAYK